MVTACMNTAGQVGGMLSPVVLALVVREFSSWAMPLYATAILYGFGALCWLIIDASKPLPDAAFVGPAFGCGKRSFQHESPLTQEVHGT